MRGEVVDDELSGASHGTCAAVADLESSGPIDCLVNNAGIQRRVRLDEVDSDELAGATIFFCSEASSFINGQMLYVDGGMISVL
jgi:NAD(P)-dependent dehydrogenase (short-subunit alcohol dehydrogenase family)